MSKIYSIKQIIKKIIFEVICIIVNIIKFISFKTIYFVINLDIVSSSMIFSNLVSLFISMC